MLLLVHSGEREGEREGGREGGMEGRRERGREGGGKDGGKNKEEGGRGGGSEGGREREGRKEDYAILKGGSRGCLTSAGSWVGRLASGQWTIVASGPS